MAEFEILSGLPSTGPLPRWIPESWARTGKEGFVVRFGRAPNTWIGNFKPGGYSFSEVAQHPNGRDLLVVAGGEPYVVHASKGVAEPLGDMPVSGLWSLPGTPDLLVEVQELAFFRLGRAGVIWHSRRISWDGFRDVTVGDDRVWGQAWSPLTDDYHPFSIDLTTGRATGGAPDVPDMAWESLAESPSESF